MLAFFSMILAKFSAALDWIGRLFIGVFQSLWHLVTDAFCWVFDSALGVAVTAIGTIDVSGISTNLSAFNNIPASVMEVMAACGAGQAFAIIATALGIRFALQLIPFVRLGS